MKTLLLIVALVSTTAWGRPIPERVQSAKEVVVNRMTSVYPIPKEVISKSKCIAALKVVKAGLIWGGQGSTGLVSCRTADNSWSTPSFFGVDGVNFGLQIGIQFLESVLTFMTDFAREVLNRTTFQLGAELSFAAGPVGTGGGVGEIPNAHVLSYQRAVGLFAGATVNGFILHHKPDLNEKAYGEPVTAIELLKTPGVEGTKVVQPYVETITQYFPMMD